MKVTDEMVETALAAYHGPVDKSIARDCAVFMRAALEAALEVSTEVGHCDGVVKCTCGRAAMLYEASAVLEKWRLK